MKPRQRDFAAVLISTLLATALAFPAAERLDALASDLLIGVRHALFGQRYPPDASRVAVVAVDEETYHTAPFDSTPSVFWTPQIGRVVDTLIAGGAAVVGFDMVFPTSLEPFLPGFERPFLLSLRNGARDGRVVLGMVQHQTNPVGPSQAQSMVVGHQRNIRPLNVANDADDVIRRVPLFFETTGGPDARIPSMATELASRALGVAPERTPDGAVSLGGYRVPNSEGGSLRINFQGGDDIPSYSLADLHACVEAGDTEFFRRQFQGKVVMVGTMLDVEDRKLTGKRFATAPERGATGERCRIAADPSRFKGLRRDTVPGIFIHAAAVNDLLRQDALWTLQQPGVSALGGLFALITTAIVLVTPPLRAALITSGLMAIWAAAALIALQHGAVLPWMSALAAMLLAYSLMLGYRYQVADQQKALIRRLFGLYLAPTVVRGMVESERLPELGGETRRVTVWFSDIRNFTTLSEGLAAQDLVTLMNRYFSEVTDIIESHGGFVDKYIGDAVVAVFGAPHEDPGHAASAVRAALSTRARLDELNRSGAFGERQIVTRTGINTGEALVGNVGSPRRFNYTVMGDTVNIASRLEGANKALGTMTLISETTAVELPPEFLLREIDQIRVKGRLQPVKVYEPLAIVTDAAEDVGAQRVIANRFQEAHALMRERRFEEAAEALVDLAAEDLAAAVLHGRALSLASDPESAENWDGVNTLQEK